MYSISVKPGKPRYEEPWAYSSGFELRTCTRLADVCKHALNFCWSPIIWRGGERKRDNFVSCQIAAIDVDEGTTIADAKEILRGCKNIILTTKSHQIEKSGKPPCDRFRILIPFERTITDLHEYEFNMDLLRRELGADKTKDGARFFWPCKAFHSASNGEAFPIQVPPPVVKKVYPRYTRENAPRLSAKLQDYIRCGIPNGQRHNAAHGVFFELLDKGYSQSEIESRMIQAIFRPASAKDEKEFANILAWCVQRR